MIVPHIPSHLGLAANLPIVARGHLGQRRAKLAVARLGRQGRVPCRAAWRARSSKAAPDRTGGVALDAFTTTRVSAIRADEIISTMVDTVLLRRLRQRERKLTVSGGDSDPGSDPDPDPQEETTEEPGR